MIPSNSSTPTSSLRPAWRSIVFVVLAFLIVGPVCDSAGDQVSSQPDENEHVNRYWNDAARYLAGMEPADGSVLGELEQAPEAQRHRQFFSQNWPRVEGKLSTMTTWAETHLPEERTNGKVIWYPFSGPDFLNLFTFFPNGPEYIMFGLEPPGNPPELNEVDPRFRATYLANIQESMSSITQFSFYRTLSMRQDFSDRKLDGLAPAIMVYIARTGNHLKAVERVYIDKEGELNVGPVPGVNEEQLPSDFKERLAAMEEVPGIRMRFRKPGESRDFYVTYFSVNVADGPFDSKPWFAKYIKERGQYNTYVKAASYLMHYDYFTQVRNLVLSESDFIMQEDSGMMLRHFDREIWDLTFFGSYVRPIPLFRRRFQQDLRDVYVKGDGIQPLPFGLGYNFQPGTSNLMMARRK